MTTAVASKPAPAAPGFDYSALAAEVATDAKAVADQFRAYEKRTVAEAIAIGAELARIKAALGHGPFGAWCEAEFGQSARTAQRLMSLQVFQGKSDTVSYLPASTLYKLATVPEKARAKIVTAIEANKLSPETVLNKALNVERPSSKASGVSAKVRESERARIGAAKAKVLAVLTSLSAAELDALRKLIRATPGGCVTIKAADLVAFEPVKAA